MSNAVIDRPAANVTQVEPTQTKDSSQHNTNAVVGLYQDFSGRTREIKWAPRCETCNHPRVHEIHALAFMDFSIPKIIEQFDIKLTPQAVRRHFRKHLPGLRSSMAGFQALVKTGTAIDGAIEELDLDNVLDFIIRQGLGAMMRGETGPPDTGDVLRAVAIKKQLDQVNEDVLNESVYAEAIMILCEGVREVLSERELTRFMWKIRSHPRMAFLMNQLEMRRAGVIDTEAHEAQLIEVPETIFASL